MVEARPDPRKGDEREERAEGGREWDEERAQAEDRNADREEAGGVPSIRHDSEEELEDRSDDERRPAKEADLGGAEPTEGHDGLQDDNLSREDRDRAVVRQVVHGVREQHPPVSGHAPRDGSSP